MGALSILWQKDLNLADARKLGAERSRKSLSEQLSA